MLQFFILILWMAQDGVNSTEKSDNCSTQVLNGSHIYLDTLPQQHFPDQIDWSNIYKAEVSLEDSILWVAGVIKKDYRIFGYERPTINSKRLILFSVFTRDVQNNPYNCPFGAYYSTSDMTFEDSQFKFRGFSGKFIKTDLVSEGVVLATFYFEKKWVQFSK